jgi:Protein of unknown function (DUF1524)
VAALPDDLTIEHVLPDVWIEHWPLPDGTNAPVDLITGMTEIQIEAITKRDALKQTVGNLTLLTHARNPSLGNQGFAVKREKLKHSLLKLNHEIAALSEWTEKEIQNRAERLARLAVGIWPGLTASSS